MAKKKASTERSVPERTLIPLEREESDFWNEFLNNQSQEIHPIVIRPEEDGRVTISMTREQAFNLYAEMYRNENKFGSFIRIPFENLLKDFFVKGTAVVSPEDLS